MKTKIDRLLSRSVLTLGFAVIATGFSDPAFAAKKTGEETLFRQETRARKKQLDGLNKKLELIRSQRGKKDYEGAKKACLALENEAKALRGTEGEYFRETVQQELQTLLQEYAKDCLARAKVAAAEGKYAQAMDLATKARSIDPAVINAAARLMEYCKAQETHKNFKSNSDINHVDSTYAAQQAEITKLLREADLFIKSSRYDDARVRLEKVFLLDPYNMAAIMRLSQVYQNMYTAGELRRRAEFQMMHGMGVWQWVEPVFPADIGTEAVKPAEVKTELANSVFEKMEKIIFPTFEFDDANVMDVIRFLNSRSKIYDPEKVGVNIVAGFDKETIDALRVKKMSFTQIPMSELLRYLCQDLGLKYKVDDSGISIGDSGESMQTQFFKVRGDLIAGITSESDAAAESSKDSSQSEDRKNMGKLGEGADAKTFFDDRAGTGTQTSLTNEELKKYFEERGVTFGEGASISYNKRSAKLIVKNTVENLRRLDELIRQLDAIETPLVMVEIKAIEITENHYQELGFYWSMNELSHNMTSTGTLTGKDGWSMTITDPQRPSVSETDSTVVNSWNIFGSLFGGTNNIFGSDVPLNVELTIKALNQSDRSEVLSAPKVMTKSSNKAEVRMVKTYRFPESWDTYEIEEDNGTVTMTAPVPSFAEASDVGIIFDVTPVVNPDNYTINLNVNPTVTNYLGKDSYYMHIVGYKTYYKTSQTSGVVKTTELVTEKDETVYEVWMPMISRRNLQVNVTVYDGETIVLGGMIDSRSESRVDKWPILGELPIIGRFFQSRSENKEQSDLLLFVTTRLVNNDGVPVRRNRSQGLPDFNR